MTRPGRPPIEPPDEARTPLGKGVDRVEEVDELFDARVVERRLEPGDVELGQVVGIVGHRLFLVFRGSPPRLPATQRWRGRMGVEPTGAGITDAHTVLKFAGAPSVEVRRCPLALIPSGFY